MKSYDILKYQFPKDFLPMYGYGIYMNRTRKFRESLDAAIHKIVDEPIIERVERKTQEQIIKDYHALLQRENDFKAIMRIDRRTISRVFGLIFLNSFYAMLAAAGYIASTQYGKQICSALENLVK